MKPTFDQSLSDVYRTWDRVHTAMQSLAQRMQKTNRILTGDLNIKVKATTVKESHIRVPGYSEGDEIYFNYDQFKDIGSSSTLVALMGLNWHELSHLLFTPRRGSAMRTFLIDGRERSHHYWNILEDQRIESLFRAMYPSSGKYFTQMVIDFLVNNEDTWDLGHAMVYGRKFVPLDIRQGFKERWAGTIAERKEIENLIDEFKRFDFGAYDAQDYVCRTTENLRILSVIDRYAEIIERIQNRTNSKLPDSVDCGSLNQKADEKPRQGSENNSKAIEKMDKQEEEQKQAEEDGDDGSGFWDDVEEDEDDDSDSDESASGSEDAGDSDDGAGENSDEESDDQEEGEGSAADSNGDDDEEGDGDSNGGGTKDDNDSDGEGSDSSGDSDSSEDHQDREGSDSDSDGGYGTDPNAGSVDQEEPDEGDFDLRDMMNQVLDEGVNNSTKIQDDVGSLRDALNDPSALDVDDNYISYSSYPVTADMVSASVETAREFSRLYADLEPGWKYGSDTGKLNAERWFNTGDPDEAFDEWEEGREQDSGLEVVIEFDTSTSMRGKKISAASKSVWIIKKACEEVGAVVSVVAFSDKTETLYQRKDLAGNEYRYPRKLGGATRPLDSLHIGRRILTESEMPNKLTVTVTDGHWQATPTTTVTRRENEENVLASTPGFKLMIVVGVTNHESAQYYDLAKEVALASDIAPIIRMTIERILREV